MINAIKNAASRGSMFKNNVNTVLWPIAKRAPIYLRLGWDLAREPSIPHKHKLTLYSLIVYQVTPIHLLLSPIPVFGQIDSLVLLLLSVGQMAAHCPRPVLHRMLHKQGLSPEQLKEDILAVNRFGGDAISRAGRKGFANVKFAGRVVGGMGVRSLARLVVAVEYSQKRSKTNNLDNTRSGSRSVWPESDSQS